MKAILLNGFGDVDVMGMGEQPDPIIGENELLIRVKAAALNRADLIQRRGLYPPPKGESEILGLEMSGEVLAVGSAVLDWKVGDRVCSLLPGGGYAELVAIPANMAMSIPDHLSYEEAAAIPEVFLTAYSNLFWLGGLKSGQKVLVHAGASGVGTAAIQLIREAGAQCIVTAGSEQKLECCYKLGAQAGWNYKEGSFAPWVKDQTNGEGVNIILDFIGAPYFAANIQALAMDGRLVIIGTMGGNTLQDVNLDYILVNRLQIIGTALRNRTKAEKIKLTQEFGKFALPLFADGRLKPVIDSIYDWKDARRAHLRMETNANVGKIILKVTA